METDKNKSVKESAKDQIINRMFNVLKGQTMFVREDNMLTTREKLEQADVLLDTMKFLNDYDENVKVLNKYWIEKHHKEKFNIKDKDEEER